MVFAGMLPKAATRKGTKITKQINKLHKVSVTPTGWPHQQRYVFESVRVFRVVRGQQLFL